MFGAREGRSFRISLTYDAPTGTGKTTAHTDTSHGHFVKLVLDEQVVEVVEFETTDPAMGGEMTIPAGGRSSEARGARRGGGQRQRARQECQSGLRRRCDCVTFSLLAASARLVRLLLVARG